MKRSRNIILCSLPVIIIAVLKILKLDNEPDTKFIMAMCLFGLAGYGCYLAYKRKLTAETVVLLVILAGIILRSGYTAYTYIFTRQHDIGMDNPDGTGHWGYLYHVINGHLPPSNAYEFYQPPLYYIITAAVIRAVMFITREGDWTKLAYMSQIVSCVASCVTLVYMEKIADELKIKKKYQIAAIALIAAYPAQILTAGRFNNDSIALMFMVLALYYTLRWHNSLKMRYIISIALSIGLGMMCKINAAMAAFVTGPLMLYHLFKCVKSKDTGLFKKLAGQFAIFALICFPCGLWYPLRNYVEFGQPLNYITEGGENATIYTGNAPWILRWVKFPANFIKVPYMNMDDDTNVIMALIKTGVHGEFGYEGMSALFAGGIDYVHAILLLFTAFAIAFVMLKRKDMDTAQVYPALWVWLCVAISYITFNIKYPYSCTADFRYVLLGQLASSLFISYLIEYSERHKYSAAYRCLAGFTVILCGVFCYMGVLHFC